MADVVLVNKVDTASPEQLERVLADVSAVNPDADLLQAESPVSLEDGPSLRGRSVLVVEDGPSITHGEMAFGAGTVAARQAGATLIDPRPNAVGSIGRRSTASAIGPVLPAMGYSAAQLRDLEQMINATDCDFVVTGTPIALGRILRFQAPDPSRHLRAPPERGPPDRGASGADHRPGARLKAPGGVGLRPDRLQ